MTNSSFLARHRRVLVLCAATVALHYAAIDWVGGRLSAQTHRPSELAPSLMTAQLRLALPKRVESAPLEDVAPLAALPRKPAASSRKVLEPVAAASPAAAQAATAAVLAEAGQLGDLAVPAAPGADAQGAQAGVAGSVAQAGAAQAR
ncbi:DUF3108 domain-containing protein, partial [Duganella radicis]|nr:DUF3108 domain-containing protein [Duganella radicis]